MRGVRKFRDRLWFIDKTYKLKYIVLDSNLVEFMKPEIREIEIDHKVIHFEFYNSYVYAMAEDGHISKVHIDIPTLRFKGFHQKEKEWFTTLLPISSKLCLLASAYRQTGSTKVDCKLSLVGGKLKYRDKIEFDCLVDSIKGGRCLHNTGGRTLNPLHVMKYFCLKGIRLILGMHYYERVSLFVVGYSGAVSLVKSVDFGVQDLTGFLPSPDIPWRSWNRSLNISRQKRGEPKEDAFIFFGLGSLVAARIKVSVDV